MLMSVQKEKNVAESVVSEAHAYMLPCLKKLT